MRKYLPIILIALLTFAAFAPSLKNDFVNWDDPPYVIDNYTIRSLRPESVANLFTTPQSSYYAPLVFLSFAVDFFFWELDPFGYHLTNVLLHVANALLVFAFLRMLSGRDRVALLAALLFALNPLRAESVAWVTERKDVLSGLFYLAALIFYLRGRLLENLPSPLSVIASPPTLQMSGGEAISPGLFYNRYYFLSLAAAVAALLSKPMAITIVPVLWLLDYYLLRSGRSRRSPVSAGLILNKIPFLLPALLLAGVAFALQKTAGTVRPAFYLDPAPHLLTAARNFVFYIHKSLFPLNLSAYYAYPDWISIFRSGFFFPILGLTGLAILVAVRGRRDPDFLWGAGFYILTILPVLQLVPIGNVVFADRFSYLPSIGIFYLLVLFFSRLAGRPRFRPLAVIMITLLLGFWGVLSFLQCRVWRDSITLWTDTLEKSPHIPTAHLNLGEAYLEEGRLDEAVVAFQRARDLEPTAVNVYTNLGDAYQKLGLLEEAEEEFLTALEIDPESAIAHNNLGLTYAKQGRKKEARKAFLTALALKEDYPEPFNNLGLIYRGEGKITEAIESFQKAIAVNSLYRDGHHNLASAYDQVGDLTRAIHHYRRAVELQPDFAPALTDVGFAYARQGLLEEAIAAFESAATLNPKSGLNYYGLALSYYFRGEKETAAFYRDRAIRFGYRDIPGEIMELR